MYTRIYRKARKNLIKGVNLHADGGPFGTAAPVSFWEYRLKQLKEIGCNAIGLSHHPHAPEFIDLCDRMGFLVNSEFADKWEPPHYVDFYEEWERDPDRLGKARPEPFVCRHVVLRL